MMMKVKITYNEDLLPMDTDQSQQNTKVTIVKAFDSPPEQVFDAWLDTEMIGRWMFGPGVRDEEIVNLESHPEKGGTFSFVVRRGDEELNHLGTYLEIERPVRLVFTWGVKSESEDESVVTIELESTENGCRLTLTHTLDPKWAEYTDRTREGWSHMLDKLKKILG